MPFPLSGPLRLLSALENKTTFWFFWSRRVSQAVTERTKMFLSLLIVTAAIPVLSSDLCYIHKEEQ